MGVVSVVRNLLFAPDVGDPYRCGGCGTDFRVQYHVCPDCGSFGVEQQSWTD